jgi:uncharacterized protein YcfJ
MNKSLITGLVVGGVAVTAAGAFAGYQAMDNRRSAEVLNVEQLTRTVRTPHQVCSDEIVTSQAPTNDPKRVTGAVLGAVVGGVVGNQIGHGTGQTVATVAGAAAGGYAGSKIQKHVQDGNTTSRSSSGVGRPTIPRSKPTATRCAIASATAKAPCAWTTTRAEEFRSRTASWC